MTHATAIFDLSLALEAYGAGRLGEAESICRTICVQAPPPVDAMHLLGLIEMAQGRLEAAVETLTAVTKFQPDDATARNNLGIALRKHGRLPEAIAAFENAVACRPTYPNALPSMLFLRSTQVQVTWCSTRTVAGVSDSDSRPPEQQRHLAKEYCICRL